MFCWSHCSPSLSSRLINDETRQLSYESYKSYDEILFTSEFFTLLHFAQCEIVTTKINIVYFKQVNRAVKHSLSTEQDLSWLTRRFISSAK